MKYIYLLLFYSIPLAASSQNYTSYFTGNTTDAATSPSGGICMMGGATEHDEAMKWFLQRADGGDVLVIRASGSDGYNNYLYSQLGVSVNSVETIVFHSAAAATEPYIHQKIAQAEAIWMAGGNQWTYISYWRNTKIDSLINDGIINRNIAIGGTSAGMAVLGGVYFSAQNGSTTSAEALANPYAFRVKVDSSDFFKTPFLNHIITDTHYDSPDRRGRHAVFLARMRTDWGVEGKGIACDEYTAVCIDTSGIARTFGDSPTYDDNVYFIQTNCEKASTLPENCTNGQPLTWDLGGAALKVYRIKATNNGSKTFDLNTWQTGNGGTWEDWSVNNGVLQTAAGNPINCTAVNTEEVSFLNHITVAPNPVIGGQLSITAPGILIQEVSIIDMSGKVLIEIQKPANKQVDISSLASGVYFLKIQSANKVGVFKIIKPGF